MKFAPYFRSVAARFLRRSEVERDLDEELRCHIQLRADDLERSGLPRAEAERRARIEFGGGERIKDECREALGAAFVDTLLQDLRFSLRVLRKSPGFTAVAVFTLALAIGANAVVFAVMNGFILRPLDVPRAETLYGIEHANEHSMYESYPDYLDLRDRNRSFEALAAFEIEMVGLDTGNNPVRAWCVAASGNYFDAFGLQPVIGRFFHASDEHGPNSAPYIVLGYGYWHTHFHDDPGVVGRVVRINKYPYTIIGVAPPAFHGAILFFSPDFYAPIIQQEQFEGKYTLDLRNTHSVFMTLGHLKPGVTPAQAAADLNSVGAYLERTYPTDHGATRFVLARPNLYGNYMGAPMRAFIAALLLLSGMILLAACANLGSLFAARAADRGREVALRLALGATRARILRQLLTEAVLVSLAGGAVGLWASVVLVRALAVWRPLPKFPIYVPLTPDGSVYAVALALAVVSGLLFGIVPVRQVLRANPYQIVKAGSASIGRRLTVRDLLLVGQIAICAVLITSSMVALRGLGRSIHTRVGFEPRNAMLVDTDLVISGYRAEKASDMQRRAIEALKAIPGVQSAGMISRPPIAEGGFSWLIFPGDAADLRPSQAVAISMKYVISPGYFEAAQTAVLAGRTVSWHDDKSSPRVAVVNREFARVLFGSAANALGGYFKNRDGIRIQVVGVVEDGKYLNLTEDPRPAVFLPLLQYPQSESWFVVRSPRDPEQLAGAIRTAIHGLDSGVPLYIQTWRRQLDFALFPSRMATMSLGVLGVIGAVLSITGIFGMAAYSVSRRMKELGIRIAVGAQRKDVLNAALGRAVRLLAIGSVAGLILGVLGARVLAVIVYQATSRDPVVLAGVAAAMLLLGILATWIPARRALSIDPLRLLREE